MRMLVPVLILISSAIASASVYECDAILGSSTYDPTAKTGSIQNFSSTGIGALAGHVVLGSMKFSLYQYQANGNVDLSISEEQPQNVVTPYLTKAHASIPAPRIGQAFSVSLTGVGYLNCKVN